MAGDIGAVATAFYKVFDWIVGEDGLKEWQQRRALTAKKKECLDALHERRWDDLRRLTDEFERLSQHA